MRFDGVPQWHTIEEKPTISTIYFHNAIITSSCIIKGGNKKWGRAENHQSPGLTSNTSTSYCYLRATNGDHV